MLREREKPECGQAALESSWWRGVSVANAVVHSTIRVDLPGVRSQMTRLPISDDPPLSHLAPSRWFWCGSPLWLFSRMLLSYASLHLSLYSMCARHYCVNTRLSFLVGRLNSADLKELLLKTALKLGQVSHDTPKNVRTAILSLATICYSGACCI